MAQSYAKARKELRALREELKCTMTLSQYNNALARIDAALEAVTAKNRPGSGWRKLIGRDSAVNAAKRKAREPKPNDEKYSAGERALIENRGAPCLTCKCSDGDRASCEAW